MNNITANNGGFGLQTNFINAKPAGLSFNNRQNNTNSAYYAKKGEPMYMKEMDADEDGIVSFEEFKDYCEANDISPREMIKMAEMASSYRTMKANQKASKNVQNKSEYDSTKHSETEAVYAKKGDAKYDEVMDTNNDDKVSYKEYIEYCKENSKPREKSDTTIEINDDGEFKTTDKGKAINSYSNSEPEESFNNYTA